MNRSLPPYPNGTTDLRLTPVLTLATDEQVTPDAWRLAAAFAVAGGVGDPATIAGDDTELPVVTDNTLFKVRLGDLLDPAVDARDLADTLRATIAAAAAHALAMKRLTAAAERLLNAPAATPTTGAPR